MKYRNNLFYNDRYHWLTVYVLYNLRTPLIIWVAWVTRQERHETTVNWVETFFTRSKMKAWAPAHTNTWHDNDEFKGFCLNHWFFLSSVLADNDNECVKDELQLQDATCRCLKDQGPTSPRTRVSLISHIYENQILPQLWMRCMLLISARTDEICFQEGPVWDGSSLILNHFNIFVSF